jgi:opacity protein-like surface antigen
MLRKTLLTGFAIVIAASTALAQDKRVEVNVFAGYSFSEGVSVQDTDIGEDQIVNRITPKSGYSWGLGVDFALQENASVGFQWGQQDSTLEASIRGAGKQEFHPMKINNYHAIFTYNFMYQEDMVRPFIFGGLGATQYTFDDLDGHSIDSNTRFSTTWGGGAKIHVHPNVAIRLTGRWTPTYINSDPGGIWCDPWYPWGCWVVGNANYSHQFEMTGGITFRF